MRVVSGWDESATGVWRGTERERERDSRSGWHCERRRWWRNGWEREVGRHQRGAVGSTSRGEQWEDGKEEEKEEEEEDEEEKARRCGQE